MAMPSLPALPATEALDAAADPGAFVIASCERAKEWLAQCLAGDHIEAIVETKAQADAIRVYTMQRQLGKDAELSAAEVVRRAERCIGLAIRKGQAEGTIRRTGQGLGDTRQLASPTDHATRDDLSGNGKQPGFYAMTDGVTDAEFESALTEAKKERNLSRANVVRKVKGEAAVKDRWAPLAKLAAKGHGSSQIAERLGFSRSTVVAKAKALGIEIPADKVLGRSKRTNHNRILTEFVNTLESLTPSVDLIDLTRVDRDVLRECSAVMEESMRALVKFRRLLRGENSGE